MKFLAFAASHRPESYNRKLINLVAAQLRADGIEVDVAHYQEFDMPVYDDSIDMPAIADRFAQRANGADGIIISAPEYNWSYPGSLKNIIDWTSCISPNPLAGKTALLMSASPGMRGGILGLNHLKSPLEACELFVYHKVLPLGNCMEAFADDLTLADPKQRQLLATILAGYIAYTRKLSHL